MVAWLQNISSFYSAICQKAQSCQHKQKRKLRCKVRSFLTACSTAAVRHLEFSSHIHNPHIHIDWLRLTQLTPFTSMKAHKWLESLHCFLLYIKSRVHLIYAWCHSAATNRMIACIHFLHAFIFLICMTAWKMISFLTSPQPGRRYHLVPLQWMP